MGGRPEKAAAASIAAAVLLLLLYLPASSPSTKENPATLRIGTTDQVKSANLLLDPNLSLYAHISNPTLMKINHEVRTKCQLLSSIEPTSDLKTWVLKIKPDLFWSDGRPVTSQDIGFTLVYLRDRYPAAGWLKQALAGIELPDRLTAVIDLKQPYGRLDFEFVTYPLLPKHIWESIENPLRYTNPGPNVGCGPFVIQRTDLNRRVVTLVKNPFWKGTQPQIDVVEIHLFTNRDVLALALEKGDVDIFYEYASSYPYANLRKLERNDRFEFLEQMNLALYFLGFNLKREPMSDPAFRKAVAYAVNYEEIIRLVLLGYGQVPRWGFVPPNMPNHKPTEACVHNPEEAARLLDQAGYSDRNQNGIREDKQGNDLRLSLMVDPAKAFNNRLTELMEEYLRAVGIRVAVKTVEGSTWVSLKDRYEYDLVITRSSPWGMLMHASWATGYFDSRRTGEGVLHTVDDAAFLELCDALLATTDPAVIVRLAQAVQDYYAAHLPAVPLFWNRIITPYNRDFSGWRLDPLYGLYNIDTLLSVRREKP
jgi:peptide/nickel transport system substrate-binding protein